MVSVTLKFYLNLMKIHVFLLKVTTAWSLVNNVDFFVVTNVL